MNHAINMGDLEKVRKLIKEGNDVNEKLGHMYTPLMVSASYGVDNSVYFEITKELLKAGANINGIDHLGNTTLMLVLSIYKNLSINTVKFLIETGTNIHITNKEGYTALMICVDKYKNHRAFDDYDSDDSYDYDSDDSDDGYDTLFRYEDSESIKRNELLKELIKAGADINYVNMSNNNKQTALAEAIEYGDLGSALSLIEAGADVNLGHQTPLMHAVRAHQLGLIKRLIKVGADVNKINNKSGFTAIVFSTDVLCAKELLKAGASLDLIVNIKGMGIKPFSSIQFWTIREYLWKVYIAEILLIAVKYKKIHLNTDIIRKLVTEYM